MTVGWSTAGLIHYSLLKPSETVTAVKYCQEAEMMTQPVLTNRKGPILHYDSARPRTSQIAPVTFQ